MMMIKLTTASQMVATKIWVLSSPFVALTTATSFPSTILTRSPGFPWGPSGPRSPLRPLGPLGPAAPALPPSPWSPSGPLKPSRPLGPCGPAFPGFPASPGGPGKPSGPFGPVSVPGTPWKHKKNLVSKQWTSALGIYITYWDFHHFLMVKDLQVGWI